MPVSNGQRAYSAATYLVELAGQSVGEAQRVDGGDALSDVVVEKPGLTPPWRAKHLAGVRWSDITMTTGIGMAKPFLDAIEKLPTAVDTRYDGAIVVADYNFNAVERRQFHHALLTAVAFPALDAASKDVAHLTVTFSPEFVDRTKGTGKASEGIVGRKQTKWLPSRFRVDIPGLDCTGVSKVSAVTLASHVVEDAVGELRDYEKQPAWLEVSDLELTLSSSRAGSFRTWHEDFVIRGNNGQDKEKTATISYLGPTGQDVLATIDLAGVGIYKLADVPPEAGADGVARTVASMYCEQASIRFGAAAPAGNGGSGAGNGASSFGDTPVIHDLRNVDPTVLFGTHVRRTVS
jgi:hypothetical protein